MKSGGLQGLSWRFLAKLYELSKGGIHPEVHYDLVKSSLGYSDPEAKSAAQYLENKRLVTFRCKVPCIKITPRGVDEVDRLMENQKKQVLGKLYKLASGRLQSIPVSDLAESLGLSFEETYDDLKFWEDRNLVEMSHDVDREYESVKLTRLGLDAVEHPGQGTPAGSQITYNMNIGANYGGAQQGGYGNIQNVTLTNTNNPDIDRVLGTLLELIRSSQIPADDKQELEDEVGKVNKLALREPAPGMLERAKSRLDMIKLAITGTDIAMKAAPHLNTLWELLQQRFGG